MNNYPIVYKQIKILKALWEKSSDKNKDEYIKAFNETLKEIEMEHLYDAN